MRNHTVSAIKSFLFKNVSRSQTIFKNTFWLVVSEAFESGVGFVTVVLLARHFGPTVYGQWSFAFNTVALFGILADFGLTTLLIRDIAADKSKTAEYIDTILVLKSLLGAAVLAIVWVLGLVLIHNGTTVSLFYILGVYTVINTFVEFFQSIFRANEKMEYETASRIIQSVSRLVLVTAFVAAGATIVQMAYAHVIYLLIGLAFAALFVWRYFSTFFKKIKTQLWLEMLKEAWPILATGLIGIAVSRLGIGLLYIFDKGEAVGFYSAAFTPVYSLSILPNLFLIALFPVFSRLSNESSKDMKSVYRQTSNYIFVTALIVFPLLFLLAGPIIHIVYGSQYADSVLVFKILLAAEFFGFIGSPFYNFFTAIHKQVVFTKMIVLALIVNVVLSLILIPRYSFIGLAFAMVATEVVLYAALWLAARKAFVTMEHSHA
jgi:O-antigen/teichoic acid export membrane protein